MDGSPNTGPAKRQAMRCLTGLALGWSVLVVILCAQLMGVDPSVETMVTQSIGALQPRKDARGGQPDTAAANSDKTPGTLPDAETSAVVKTLGTKVLDQERINGQERMQVFVWLVTFITFCGGLIGYQIMDLAKSK